MKKLLIQTFAVVACLHLSGCIIVPVPGAKTVASAVSGTVVDSKTRKPIPNATVMWSYVPQTQVKTDDAGRFSVRDHKEFYLMSVYALTGDLVAPKISSAYQFEASHPEYQKTILTVPDMVDEQHRIGVTPITITLKRK